MLQEEVEHPKRTKEEVKARLLAKYSGRKKRRRDAIIHKASKIIAEIVVEEKVKPVMEELKNMREK
jgi:hypothetical protein